jgi:teichuronic acid biosynthesis glycosyltransferase TuaG
MSSEQSAEHQFPVTVSIIMASFNCGPFIEEAVQSVLAQTFNDWELIISDDGSTDQTPILLSRIRLLDSRIGVIEGEKNQGAARARNAALSLARGRYIAFLDSDDLWRSDKLERQISYMKAHRVPFCFGSYERISETGANMGLVAARAPVTYKKMLSGNRIGCLTAVYDTAFFGKVPMPDIKKRQDYGLWLQLLKKVDRAEPIAASLGFYRLRPSSLSANKANAALHTWRLLRDQEQVPFPRALVYFSRYVMRAIWSHYGPRR